MHLIKIKTLPFKLMIFMIFLQTYTKVKYNITTGFWEELSPVFHAYIYSHLHLAHAWALIYLYNSNRVIMISYMALYNTYTTIPFVHYTTQCFCTHFYICYNTHTIFYFALKLISINWLTWSKIICYTFLKIITNAYLDQTSLL